MIAVWEKRVHDAILAMVKCFPSAPNEAWAPGAPATVARNLVTAGRALLVGIGTPEQMARARAATAAASAMFGSLGRAPIPLRNAGPIASARRLADAVTALVNALELQRLRCCIEPDRDNAALFCGYPQPCPWHSLRPVSRDVERN